MLKMSAQKRECDGNGSRSSGSKKKPKILNKKALGVFPIIHTYVPYLILNRITRDKVHKNKEKSRELLVNLDMGNNCSIELIDAMSDKEVIKAINELFERDQDLLKRLLNGEIKIEDFGTLRFPEIFHSKVQLALNFDPE